MKTMILCVALAGCLGLASNSYSQTRSISEDFDGDGYLSYEHGGTDCDDLNFRVNPGATPSTSGSDRNCNGIVDYQEVVFKYGDINRSERIDATDLRLLLIEFGRQESCAADINHDNKVDSRDLFNMLNTHNTLTYGF